MSEIRLVDILEVDDIMKEQVREWRNKDDVRKFMLNQHTISKEEHSGWLERLQGSNSARFWVAFAGDTPIGAAYLHDIDLENSDSEWGFYIGEDGYRGKGLSKNILFRLLDKAFGSMNLATLFTKVISNNEKALAIYKAFNFKEIDRLQLKNGNEIVQLAFRREDWLRLKKEMGSEFGYKDTE